MPAPPAKMTVAWMPLSDDASLHRDVLARARSYGVSQLHLSHAICHDADDLLADAARAARVASLVRDCRAAGLGVWCWTHEVCKPPPACLRDGKLDFDQPKLWTHLVEKYRRFLTTALPDLDGLVLTCAETDFLVYQDSQLQSSRGPASRTARLALALHEACSAQGRKLALRDFVYRRAEVDDMAHAIAECRPELIVMTKSVPHDWHPFYPPNPLLGAVGGREQWIEFDFGHEYEGQHLYPYAEVEATLGRLRHGFARGVRTVVARLDRAVEFRGASALHSPWGRLELLTLQRFAADPRVEAHEIWREWGAGQFPEARRAVERATHAVQHLLFPRQFWYADHSRLPTWDYAASHLVDGNADRLPQWTGDARHLECDRRFRTMPESWLRELLAEADRGLELARESAAAITSANLPAADAAAWRAGAESLLAWMELFARHRAAFFRIEFARHHPGRVSAGQLDAAIDDLDRACSHWAPRLSHQRLENASATANFPSMLASLRAARSSIATAQPIAR